MSDTGKSKIDIDQLLKILSLSQSDSDGEALNAIRMANSKLKAAGLTWQDIVNSNNSSTPNKAAPSKPKGQHKWKEAPNGYNTGFFKACMDCKPFIASLDRDNLTWINKLIDFFNKHKYLPQSAWTDFIVVWDNFRDGDRHD